MRSRRTSDAVVLAVAAVALAGAAVTAPLARAGQSAFRRSRDPVALLDRKIEAGELAVVADPNHGYLAALLEAFDIPVSSQGLVFSRTSLQTDRITPWSPRAVYFNDDVYVGWVKDSPVLEIAAIDPDGGTVFYTVAQDGGARPVFNRQTTTCLMCHESRAVTSGISGVIVRSVLTDRHGYVIDSVHEGSSTDRTPLAERFGGWYVTGEVAGGHAGNAMSPLLSHEVPDPARYRDQFEFSGETGASLAGKFDLGPYLSEHSDVVAQLVLTHQARVHNVMILARQATDEALADQKTLILSTGAELPPSGILPATQNRIDAAADRLLNEMLFVRAAPLPGPVRGSSGFTEDFVARGPADPQGRSLRDLELESRLFRYPLSFLIYSDSFDALPDAVKERFYTRLQAVLTGRDTSAEFAHLGDSDRAAILEILEATKPEFAARRD